MRSPKQRSRSKQNRPKTLGNIVNRVFDSSGPEGKVRGTPQQIIEKYQLLARDAQLSNDRVAAENFQQHAEHYTRMLAQAQREMQAEADARRIAHEEQQRQRQQQDDRQNRHHSTAPRREHEDAIAAPMDMQPENATQDVVSAEPDRASSGFTLLEDEAESSGLVDTPEMTVAAPQPAENTPRPPRDRGERRPDKRRESPQADAPARHEHSARAEQAGPDAAEAAKPRRNMRRPRKPDTADTAPKAAE